MAAGEYVSVSSQADTSGRILTGSEGARYGTRTEPAEPAGIYVTRALRRSSPDRSPISSWLTTTGAHARDELSMSEMNRARPIQAACPPPRIRSWSGAAASPRPVRPDRDHPPGLIEARPRSSWFSAPPRRAWGARRCRPARYARPSGGGRMGCTALVGRLFGTVAA